MEKASDLFKELKDRINNPLVISFVISWIFLNWRIFVALLFYKSGELSIDNYKSYIDLIEKNNIDHYHRNTAILIAIIYTLFYPLIKQIILIFGTFFDKWGVSLSLKVVGSASVPFSEVRAEQKRNQNLQDEVTSYTKVRDSLNEEIAHLKTEVTNIEKEKSEEIAKITQKLNKEVTEANGLLTGAYQANKELEDRINELEIYKPNFLIGYWELIYENGTKALINISSDEVRYYVNSNLNSNVNLQLDKVFRILETTSNSIALVVTIQLYYNGVEPAPEKYFWRILLESENGKYNCISLNNNANSESNFTLIRQVE